MSLRVHGTVEQGSKPAYVFGEVATQSAQPISGARVRLFFIVNETGLRCDSTKHEPEVEVETDAAGRFELPATTVGGMLFVDTYFGICIEHPGYEPFGYVREIGEGDDRDYTGRSYLNVVLVPRASARPP